MKLAREAVHGRLAHSDFSVEFVSEVDWARVSLIRPSIDVGTAHSAIPPQCEASVIRRIFRARDTLGGIVMLRHLGAENETSAAGLKLYDRLGTRGRDVRAIELHFVPYYAWANRAATPMQVWTPVLRA